MTIEEYYIAPPQEIFEDIKENAIKIWQAYDDTYGYSTGKINAIKDIGNVKDNAWYMVAMFDGINKLKLIKSLKPESAEMVLAAMTPTQTETAEFFVCDNHIATGGYESCCACSEGRQCSEANGG